MIKIGYSCVYYPVAMGRYLEAAFRRRKDVELWTVGPYTGTFIPWNYGMHLPAKYAVAPSYPLPPQLTTTSIPFSMVTLPRKSA